RERAEIAVDTAGLIAFQQVIKCCGTWRKLRLLLRGQRGSDFIRERFLQELVFSRREQAAHGAGQCELVGRNRLPGLRPAIDVLGAPAYDAEQAGRIKITT